MLTRKNIVKDFDSQKLQKSINKACLAGDITDTVFPVALSKRVEAALRPKHEVMTVEIRDEVFNQLDQLSAEEDKTYPKEIKEKATQVKVAWQKQEGVKADYMFLESEIIDLRTQLGDCKKRCEYLKTENERIKAATDYSSSQGNTDYLARTIQRVVGTKPALCISALGKTAFVSAFKRHGLAEDDFARLFEEKRLDGKQSGLNSDLKRYVHSYPYVLYASDGLRHLSDPKIRKASNLISGAEPNDVVQRFVERLGESGH